MSCSTPITNDRLLTRIANRDDVVIHQPVTAEGAPTMTQDEAVARLEDVVAGVGASVLIVRGQAMCHKAAQSDALSPILWSYITDFHFPASIITPLEVERLRYIAQRSRRLFMQTEDSRSYVESIVPEAPGKTLVMNPTVPDDFFVDLDTPREPGPLRLIYAGKFAPDWRTLEMLHLPAGLAERGVDSTLTMVGDKIGGADYAWHVLMDEALHNLPANVTWAGGLPREQALELVRQHDVGLSWRAANLDASLEISTKMLEYAASGTPPVLNRTRAHEALLGADYPLMLDDDSEDTVLAALSRASGQLDQIRAKAQAAVRWYSSSATAARFEEYFRRAEPDLDRHPLRPGPLKVVLAGHDLKFAGELIGALEARPDVDLRLDHWAGLSQHDESASQELLDWADVVICEWAGPNAVWYSARVRDDQRLVVRLHRFELTSAWLPDIDIDKVDAVITVSRYYQRVVRENTPWPHEKIHAIPNAVDVADLDRQKRPGARHTIGMVGIVPFLKRPDRALDLVEALLAKDARFRFLIRGRMPWEYPWIWRKPEEQEPYLDFFERIGRSPQLRNGWCFRRLGPTWAVGCAAWAGWCRRPISRASTSPPPRRWPQAPCRSSGRAMGCPTSSAPSSCTTTSTRWSRPCCVTSTTTPSGPARQRSPRHRGRLRLRQGGQRLARPRVRKACSGIAARQPARHPERVWNNTSGGRVGSLPLRPPSGAWGRPPRAGGIDAGKPEEVCASASQAVPEVASASHCPQGPNRHPACTCPRPRCAAYLRGPAVGWEGARHLSGSGGRDV